MIPERPSTELVFASVNNNSHFGDYFLSLRLRREKFEDDIDQNKMKLNKCDRCEVNNGVCSLSDLDAVSEQDSSCSRVLESEPLSHAVLHTPHSYNCTEKQ